MSRSLRKTMTITLVGLSAAALGVAGATEKPASTVSEKPGMMQTMKDSFTSPPPRITPRTVTMDVGEFAPVLDLRPVRFDFDKATLRRADAPIVDANAEWLRAHPTQAVLIEGHADERGDPRYNMGLAERRARALRDALVARGVPSSRIAMASYGEARPACRTPGEPCWRESRAAVILVEPIRPQAP